MTQINKEEGSSTECCHRYHAQSDHIVDLVNNGKVALQLLVVDTSRSLLHQKDADSSWCLGLNKIHRWLRICTGRTCIVVYAV
mmetsp:Transcript_47134/g.115102  ORF Transcript_47134/g.115102 Transcript_47134/m.115102 type:complete len:83 (+) Transcript_47134:94-342(+)